MADTKYMEKQYYSATLGEQTYQVYVSLGGGEAVVYGDGSPESVLSAGIGTLYRDTTNGILYIKESGTSNTGWLPLFPPRYSTAAADDTTPSVLGLSVLSLDDNTGATAITALDDAVAGQRVTLVQIGSSNLSTIADGGNFSLAGAWSGAGTGDTITLVSSNGTHWYEECRSNN